MKFLVCEETKNQDGELETPENSQEKTCTKGAEWEKWYVTQTNNGERCS